MALNRCAEKYLCSLVYRFKREGKLQICALLGSSEILGEAYDEALALNPTPLMQIAYQSIRENQAEAERMLNGLMGLN